LSLYPTSALYGEGRGWDNLHGAEKRYGKKFIKPPDMKVGIPVKHRDIQ
jgi:hypothetical protein